MLAVLLLDADRAVAMDRLLAALWDSEPPALAVHWAHRVSHHFPDGHSSALPVDLGAARRTITLLNR